MDMPEYKSLLMRGDSREGLLLDDQQEIAEALAAIAPAQAPGVIRAIHQNAEKLFTKKHWVENALSTKATIVDFLSQFTKEQIESFTEHADAFQTVFEKRSEHWYQFACLEVVPFKKMGPLIEIIAKIKKNNDDFSIHTHFIGWLRDYSTDVLKQALKNCKLTKKHTQLGTEEYKYNVGMLLVPGDTKAHQKNYRHTPEGQVRKKLSRYYKLHSSKSLEDIVRLKLTSSKDLRKFFHFVKKISLRTVSGRDYDRERINFKVHLVSLLAKHARPKLLEEATNLVLADILEQFYPDDEYNNYEKDRNCTLSKLIRALDSYEAPSFLTHLRSIFECGNAKSYKQKKARKKVFLQLKETEGSYKRLSLNCLPDRSSLSFQVIPSLMEYRAHGVIGALVDLIPQSQCRVMMDELARASIYYGTSDVNFESYVRPLMTRIVKSSFNKDFESLEDESFSEFLGKCFEYWHGDYHHDLYGKCDYWFAKHMEPEAFLKKYREISQHSAWVSSGVVDAFIENKSLEVLKKIAGDIVTWVNDHTEAWRENEIKARRSLENEGMHKFEVLLFKVIKYFEGTECNEKYLLALADYVQLKLLQKKWVAPSAGEVFLALAKTHPKEAKKAHKSLLDGTFEYFWSYFMGQYSDATMISAYLQAFEMVGPDGTALFTRKEMEAAKVKMKMHFKNRFFDDLISSPSWKLYEMYALKGRLFARQLWAMSKTLSKEGFDDSLEKVKKEVAVWKDKAMRF